MSDEFVMVRRNVLADACSFDDGIRLSAQHAIEGLLAQPHQGEPVALPARQPNDDPAWWYGDCPNHDYDEVRGYADGWNACLDEISKLGRLYTHADPGEVERLTDQLEVADQATTYAAQQAKEKQKITDALMADAKQFRGERDTLRAQLAERDALLRALKADCETDPMYVGPNWMRRIDAALSASAEPSAPAYPRVEIVRAHRHTCASCKEGEGFGPCDCGAIVDGVAVKVDERAEFETWAKEQGLSVNRTPKALCFHNGMSRAAGDYIDLSSLCSYAAWQARAALERKP